MLSKSLRIKIAEFNKIPQKTTKIYSSNFNLFVKNKSGGTRFVISVPKSVDKRASKRNYTRRVIEQAILSIKNDLKANRWVLIRAKQIINTENKKSLELELGKVLLNEFSN